MMLDIQATKKIVLRLAVGVALALGAGGCSSLPDMPSMPDWVDPTTWFGSESPSTAEESEQAPDLADLPNKPEATKPDNQIQVAESLEADRRHAQYSAEVLRGGTGAAASPPPNAPVPASTVAEPLSVSGSKTQQGALAPAPSATAPVRAAAVDSSIAQEPTGRSLPGALPPPSSGAVRVASAPEQPAAAPQPAQQVAEITSSSRTQPEIAPRMAAQPAATITPSDAALGYKPSTAPPLDPTISQFVATPIIERYKQTAAAAGIPSIGPAVTPPTKPKLRQPRRASRGLGGPETMSGAVVANLEAIPGNMPEVYASPGGLPPAAVIFFPGDSVYLNAEGRAQVRAAVDLYKSRSEEGFIRVVGHSSSRTPNMSLKRHLQVIFRKSQDRADAVAREIIRQGVPADKVLVEAVGDSQPVYYESMPKGEEGNRRTEIFLQS